MLDRCEAFLELVADAGQPNDLGGQITVLGLHLDKGLSSRHEHRIRPGLVIGCGSRRLSTSAFCFVGLGGGRSDANVRTLNLAPERVQRVLALRDLGDDRFERLSLLTDFGGHTTPFGGQAI